MVALHISLHTHPYLFKPHYGSARMCRLDGSALPAGRFHMSLSATASAARRHSWIVLEDDHAVLGLYENTNKTH